MSYDYYCAKVADNVYDPVYPLRQKPTDIFCFV